MTKNDLPYTGIIAKEVIPANEPLITIPKKLILTLKKARDSEISRIFEENP